jgi:hypothetical protein
MKGILEYHQRYWFRALMTQSIWRAVSDRGISSYFEMDLHGGRKGAGVKQDQIAKI